MTELQILHLQAELPRALVCIEVSFQMEDSENFMEDEEKDL